MRQVPRVFVDHTLFITLVAALFAGGIHVTAQTTSGIPAAITTPDKVETRIGTLDFKDGAPSKATLDKVYDNLDFTHAFEAFVNTFQGVNMAAARKGLLDIGVKDNEIALFSELMDAKSLFLTANADTVYFFGFIDLTKGPMVLETPPKALGTLDDMWWRWVTDFGLPGPDRGMGGKYLLLPPGYDGPVPDGGFFVARVRTTRVVILGRMFMENNDPKPAADSVRKFTKIYPYEAGGVGTPIAEFLDGKARLGRLSEPPPTVFHEVSGKSFSTIPPNDFSYFEMLNDVVQQEPATSLDPELMGPLAAIGIVKGKKFEPDARMKKIMTEALALANATSRSLLMHPRDPSWFYYPDSAWYNMLFISGYEFETPIPMIEGPVRGAMRIPEGVKPFPTTGYRQLDARTSFFYGVTGITPAMAMRMTGIGSQYIFSSLDADKNYFDGSKTYKCTLPKDVPAEKFWSFTLYDNQTRSMLDTPQRYPRAGSQSYPSPAAEPNADGSTTVYFSPTQPQGVKRGNWIQTDPKKGWFVILRLYSPLEPFFDEDLAADRDRAGEMSSSIEQEQNTVRRPIMKTEYSRRSVIAVGALALIDTAMTGRAKAQAPEGAKPPAGDPKAEKGDAIKTRTASCNCGQLRVTCKGPDPERITMCSCYLCQKQSGSVFAVQARFPKEQVTIEGKSTAWKIPLEAAKALPYRNCAALAGGVTFHFCSVCGSTVYYTADADDARIGVKIGTFADPKFPPPKISGFEEYRHPWAMDVAQLPMEHVE